MRYQLPALVPENEEDEEQLEADRRHDQEIHGGDAGRMIMKESLPYLRPPSPTLRHVLGDRRLSDFNSELQQFERLNILINNAGIRKYGKVDEASWNEILSVNLMSYVFCAKAAVPLMRRDKRGAIVNVASVRSVVTGGGNLQYDTSKTAIAGLTRALAADHSSEGIRMNAVGPGASDQFSAQWCAREIATAPTDRD